MTQWQRRARFAVAIFGLVFGTVVYFAIDERQAVEPLPILAGLELFSRAPVPCWSNSERQSRIT